jgi:hypothetical protein
MALVKKGGRTYFYKSRRDPVDGRVHTKYIAAGEVALALQALADQDRREARQHAKRMESLARRRRALAAERRRLHRAERAALDTIEDDLARWSAATERLFRSEMGRRGYHLHRRGTWRRRRYGAKEAVMLKTKTKPVPDPNPPAPAPGPDRQEVIADLRVLFAEARDRAKRGEPGSMDLIHRLLDEHEETALAFLRADPAAALEGALVERLADDPARRLAMRRHLARLSTSLVGPDAGALETLLARRVVVCWADATLSDLAGLAADRIALLDDEARRRAEYYDRRRDRSARRLSMSIKSLLMLRHALAPRPGSSVEVNVSLSPPAPAAPEPADLVPEILATRRGRRASTPAPSN